MSMAKKISPKFIDSQMTTDTELSAETGARIAEDLTFLKSDGSRQLSGTLNFANNDANNIKRSVYKSAITVPEYITATTNGSVSLTVNSASVQFITGIATNFSLVLPNATTLLKGTNFEIYNRSSAPIIIKYADGSLLGVLDSEAVSSLILQDNTTQNGIFSPFTVEIAQAAGILNYHIHTDSAFTTSSAIDVLVTGMTVTPAAGEYFVSFNSSQTTTISGAEFVVSLYRDDMMIPGSSRSVKAVGVNFISQSATQTVYSFNGSQQLRIYVKVSSGSVTITNRSLVLMRMGGQA